MGIKDFLFSVAEELAKSAKQPMPLKDWQAYLRPGRVLTRGGIQFPLRKDEVQHGALGKLGPQMGSADVLSPDEMGTLLHNVRKYSTDMPEFQTHQAGTTSRGMAYNDRMHYKDQYQLPGPKLGQSEELTTLPSSDFVASTAHFGGKPGLLSWSRTTRRPVISPENDVVNPGDGGETAQHIEEIQSDWHQRGRDEGYALGPDAAEEYDRLRNKLNTSMNSNPIYTAYTKTTRWGDKSFDWWIDHDGSGFSILDNPKRFGMTPEDVRDYTRMKKLYWGLRGNKPPPAPYKDTYAELELKKNIAKAIDQGDSYVTWTTGDQQADRWGQALRNTVDELHWKKTPDGKYTIIPMKGGNELGADGRFENLSPADLGDTVGRDIAKRIVEGEGRHQPLSDQEKARLDQYIQDRDEAVNRSSEISNQISDLNQENRQLYETETDGGRQRVDNLTRMAALARERDRHQHLIRETSHNWDYNDLARRYAAFNTMGPDAGVITSDNLTIGGRGMRKFYDRDVPAAAKKLADQYGGEVTKIKIPGESAGSDIPPNVHAPMVTLLAEGHPNSGSLDEDDVHDNIHQILTSVAGGEDEGAPQYIDDAAYRVIKAINEPHSNPDIEDYDNWYSALNGLKGALQEHYRMQAKPQEVHALRLTPKMVENVKKIGLPLFSAGTAAAMGLPKDYSPDGSPAQGFAEGGLVKGLFKAALRHIDTGEIYTGANHLDALADYVSKNHPNLLNASDARNLSMDLPTSKDDFLNSILPKLEDGFVNSNGDFVTRHQALSDIRNSQPMNVVDEELGLHSSDLDNEGTSIYDPHVLPPDIEGYIKEISQLRPGVTDDGKSALDYYLDHVRHYVTNVYNGDKKKVRNAINTLTEAWNDPHATNEPYGNWLNANQKFSNSLTARTPSSNTKFASGGLISRPQPKKPLPDTELDALTANAQDPFWWVQGYRAPVDPNVFSYWEDPPRGDTAADPISGTINDVGSALNAFIGSGMQDLTPESGPLDIAAALGNDLATVMTGGGKLSEAVAKPALELLSKVSPAFKRMSPLAMLGIHSKANQPAEPESNPISDELWDLQAAKNAYYDPYAPRGWNVPEQPGLDIPGMARGGSIFDRLSGPHRAMHEALYRLPGIDDLPETPLPAASGATGVASGTWTPTTIAATQPTLLQSAPVGQDGVSLTDILGSPPVLRPGHLPVPPHPDISMENDMRTWKTTAPPAIEPLIQAAATQHGVPLAGLRALLEQESAFDPHAVSPVGARGIAQFMPATARDFGIDPFNPTQAIPAAAKYLRALYDKFGSWDKALAAYNWGQGNVARHGINALPKETADYVANLGPQFS